jgi:AAA15 family ATPase/GTPase
MLIKFKLSNYLSFKGITELSLEPSSIKEFHEDNVINDVLNTEVLKCVVLYGANSSGKSNLFKALEFVKRLILESSKDKQANEKIDVQSFLLSSETENKPSCFELEFITNNIKYKYGFEVDATKVHKEWLYYTKKLKEYAYFTRENGKITISDKFIGAKGLDQKTRENALFLSVVAQWNGAVAIEIINWINNIRFISDFNQPFNNIDFTASHLDISDPYYHAITRFLGAADLGFDEVKAEKIRIGPEMLKGLPKEVKDFFLTQKQDHLIVSTIHSKYDSEMNRVGSVYFNLSKNESLGTQKYFSLAGHVIDALAGSSILIVDELDSRLHPALSSLIVRLFNSRVNNKNHAQLICATHNTNLLSKKILRRDQVILTQKDNFGATKIRTLLEGEREGRFVRNDAAFEKNYLDGLYDAIPRLANDLDLFISK